ncbi:MAG: ubiquinol oxidase subunit II [Hyphomonadaceae bacterium]
MVQLLIRRFGPILSLSLIALTAGCERAVLDPAGDVALQQRDLIYFSTGLMLLVIVPVMVLTALFAWHYRQSNKKAVYDPNFHHSTALELVIWSIPLLIIICLGAVTWSSTHLLDPFRRLDRIEQGRAVDAAVEPMRVQVVAMDWKWLFIYPEENIATVNELVLPVDREVRFDITSTNMMNTFYAPTLAGMIYAMPGMQSALHAVLNEPGEYEGFSGNYSGAGFSSMRFRLRGVSQAEFDQWVRQTQDTGTPLTTASYLDLEAPTERHPMTLYSTAPRDLFTRIVNRCVRPGTPCIRDQMDHSETPIAPSNAPAASGERGPQGPAHAPAPSSHTAPVTGDTAHGGEQ